MKKNFTFILMWFLCVYSLNTTAKTRFENNTFENTPISNTRIPMKNAILSASPNESNFCLTNGFNIFSRMWIGVENFITPPDQNFDSQPIDNLWGNTSTDIDGVRYTGGPGADRFSSVRGASDVSPNPAFSGRAILIGNNTSETGGYAEFFKIDNSTNFKLVSLKIETYPESGDYASEYTIIGYDNGTPKVSVDVNMLSAGTYGLENNAIVYSNFYSAALGASSGLLTFGSSWENIDQVRFQIKTPSSGYYWIGLDDIDFEPAVVSVSAPSVTTSAVTSITATDVTFNGNVTADGGATVTERGFVYATTTNPTTSNTKIQDGTGTGAFTEAITGLTASTTYYVRTYAINSVGTVYGNEVSFTTESITEECTINSTVAPVADSYELFSQSFTACVDGKINAIKLLTNAAGSAYPVSTVTMTIREGNGLSGTILKTIDIPTSIFKEATSLNDYITIDLSSQNILVSNGLQYTFGFEGNPLNKVQIYYSDNNPSASIYSGGQLYFGGAAVADRDLIFVMEFGPAAMVVLPSVSTSVTTSITTNDATFSGNVTEDGGATITERGFVYGTTANPTTANTKVTDGTGADTFSEAITGLTASTTYYVRAYAINSAGTAYGNEESFTTSSDVSPSSNNALHFDSDAKINNLSGISPTSFTIEFWLKSQYQSPVDANKQYQGIYWQNSGTEPGVYMDNYDVGSNYGTQTLAITPSASVATTYQAWANGVDEGDISSVQQATWRHYAITSNGSSINFYYDGVLIRTQAFNGAVLPINNVTIGGIYGLNGFTLDELRIWNFAKTQVQIQAQKNTEVSPSSTGLVRYYDFNQGTANGNNTGVMSLPELTGNGAAATLSNFTLSGFTSNWVGGSPITSVAPVTTIASLTTSAVTSITSTGATFNGNVTADGGATVTERGFVYATTTNPTTSNTKVQDGTGTGAFTKAIAGLTASTIYYVRAYAVNSVGTSYGNEVNFTTSGTAVNNTPVINGLPATLTFTEDQQEAEMNLSSVTISDADAGSADLTVTLTATSGTFDFAGGTGITSSGNLTSTISITGSLTNINNYLNQPSNTWYIPATNVNGKNAASITFKVSDNGNTGTGGDKTAEGIISINITPINDAPNATELAISGTLNVGQTLTATYSYNDVENDTESGSTFKWFRSDNDTGLNKVTIVNATSNTYTLIATDANKYISFEVTPRDGVDFGSAVESTSYLVKIPITVTANPSQTKIYGENDPVLTYTVTPDLLSGDSFTGTLTRDAGENIGNYAITQGTLSAGNNYSITYVAKDFAITAKPITVTADASQTKVYGTVDPTFTYSVS
ncbi:MBG domain-containing protein, partial [Flavobacterium sp. ARAG 55.4]|uniref:MBG domain-containing protein n=1 Tax=Flavobacterium sp. ARAG 55.4 TaxID=3451357 RepID=UPI003F44BE2E